MRSPLSMYRLPSNRDLAVAVGDGTANRLFEIDFSDLRTAFMAAAEMAGKKFNEASSELFLWTGAAEDEGAAEHKGLAAIKEKQWLSDFVGNDRSSPDKCEVIWSDTAVGSDRRLVALWLAETVLGLRPAKPGCAEVQFSPNPLYGIRSCQGRIATLHGVLYAEWYLDKDDQLYKFIEVPATVGLLR